MVLSRLRSPICTIQNKPSPPGALLPRDNRTRMKNPRDIPSCSLQQFLVQEAMPAPPGSPPATWPQPEPVTSAAAARAVPPWCQRSQGRPLLPSRWLPAALLLTPSSLRMPGSSPSARNTHKSSVIHRHRPGQQPLQEEINRPCQHHMPG